MSTPYAWPFGATRRAESRTSSPAPLPRSRTRSPGRRSARSIGLPHPRLEVASNSTDASSPVLYSPPQPVCICDFTATFDISQPTVSHHMARLRDAGLVEVTKRGIWSFYSLASELPGATRRILDAIG